MPKTTTATMGKKTKLGIPTKYMQHCVSTVAIAKFQSTFESLLATQAKAIGDSITSYPTAHGVYVISDPTDGGIVYVGQSKNGKDGLRGRMKQHVYCRRSSDLIMKLGRDIELTRRHLVRYVEILDFNDRRLIEHFGIAIFNPKFNR